MVPEVPRTALIYSQTMEQFMLSPADDAKMQQITIMAPQFWEEG